MRSDPLNKIAAKQMIKISFKKRYNKQKKIYKQIENQEKLDGSYESKQKKPQKQNNIS